MSVRDQAVQILEGLGGKDNIKSLEPCITRLRVELHDQSKLQEATLRKAGAHGVMRMGGAVQVVIGPMADNIESEMRTMMGDA